MIATDSVDDGVPESRQLSATAVWWLLLSVAGLMVLLGIALSLSSAMPHWGLRSATLHQAAIHWPGEIVPLIRAGRDVNELQLGHTPLHRAVTSGKVDSVRLLLQEGADPNLFDSSGTTSPAVAATGSHASGDPPPGPPLASPFLHIQGPEDRAMMLMLLDAGADPNVRGVFGKTPLHQAVEAADLLMVNRLLNAGADVSIKDDFDHTPLDLIGPDGPHADQLRNWLRDAAAERPDDTTSRTTEQSPSPG